MQKRLRFRDLVTFGIVKNRVTLTNWIRDHGFPPGQLTGPNSRTWGEGEVGEWLESRPIAPKPDIITKRPRGRPRKAVTAETQSQT